MLRNVSGWLSGLLAGALLVGDFAGVVGNSRVGWRLTKICWRLCGVCWRLLRWLGAYGDCLDTSLSSLETLRVLLEASSLVGGFRGFVVHFTELIGDFGDFVGNSRVGWRFRRVC